MGWSGQGGSVWIGRGGDPSAVATPLGDAAEESEASELLIARLIVSELLESVLVAQAGPRWYKSHTKMNLIL